MSETEVVQQSSTGTNYAEYLHPKNILKIPGIYTFLPGFGVGFVLGIIWGFIKAIPGLGHAIGFIFNIQKLFCKIPVIGSICTFVVALRFCFFCCLFMISSVAYYITGSTWAFAKFGGLLGLWSGFYCGSWGVAATYGDASNWSLLTKKSDKKKRDYLQ